MVVKALHDLRRGGRKKKVFNPDPESGPGKFSEKYYPGPGILNPLVLTLH